MRHVVRKRDRHEREDIGARHLGQRCARARQRTYADAEEQVYAEEEQRYQHDAKRVHYADAARTQQPQSDRLHSEPVRSLLKAVECYGGEREHDESANLPRHSPDGDQPGCPWTQVELPPRRIRTLVAGVAVHAVVIGVVRVTVQFAIAAVAADHAHLRRRESSEYAEQHGERIAVPQPDMLAEDEHTAERVQRIDDDQHTQIAGHDGAWVHIFQPDEGEERKQRGHSVPAVGVWARRRHTSANARQQPLRPLEQRLPGIYQHPQVAE